MYNSCNEKYAENKITIQLSWLPSIYRTNTKSRSDTGHRKRQNEVEEYTNRVWRAKVGSHHGVTRVVVVLVVVVVVMVYGGEGRWYNDSVNNRGGRWRWRQWWRWIIMLLAEGRESAHNLGWGEHSDLLVATINNRGGYRYRTLLLMLRRWWWWLPFTLVSTVRGGRAGWG